VTVLAEKKSKRSPRQATILKYIDFRFRPLVRAERATRPGSGDAASGDTASGEEELQARIEEWVQELRGEATIRYNPTDPEGPIPHEARADFLQSIDPA